MSTKKLPEADLQDKYQKRLELSFVFSLLVVTLVFYSVKDYKAEPEPLPPMPDLTFDVFITPPTVQLKRPPKPSQPSILEESEDDDITDMENVAFLFDPTLQTEDFAPPVPEEEEEEYKFWAVSVKPVLLHQETPKYPALAQKAGIEGTVVIEVLISKTGEVIDASVVGEENLLSQAALDAAMKCKFKPAKQRDKFVRVRMSIPFEFRLR
jgi:periplasmic protein TonB